MPGPCAGPRNGYHVANGNAVSPPRPAGPPSPTARPEREAEPCKADRALHALAARLTGGISPIALSLAYIDWAWHLAAAPQRQLHILDDAWRSAGQLFEKAAQGFGPDQGSWSPDQAKTVRRCAPAPPATRASPTSRARSTAWQGVDSTVVGLDGDASATIFDDPCPEGRVAIVVGSEGEGMSRLVRERCDVLVSLPMRGRVGSLNASASLAAALYGYVLPSRHT